MTPSHSSTQHDGTTHHIDIITQHDSITQQIYSITQHTTTGAASFYEICNATTRTLLTLSLSVFSV
jgi:hypothetical protein